MFQKKYLTTIQNNLLLQETTAVVLKTGNSWQKSFVSKTVYLLECVRVVVRQLAPIPKGIFLYLKNLYVRSTKQQKTSSQKLDNQRQKKTIKQIISNILGFVKEKIAILKFAENKPKKREFTLEDLTLIQKLVEKNNGDFPKSWAQFYKLTGTSPETFNN